MLICRRPLIIGECASSSHFHCCVQYVSDGDQLRELCDGINANAQSDMAKK